jgi:flagellar biogenesis protein FliO
MRVLRPFNLGYAGRRLRTLETLSLGNKRTISLVQVDGQDFLIGGTANSLVLLAKLEAGPERVAVLGQASHPTADFDAKVQDMSIEISNLVNSQRSITDFDAKVQ